LGLSILCEVKARNYAKKMVTTQPNSF